MITLFTAPTGNGHRAAIMLEETGLAYEARRVDFAAGEHLSDTFKAVNPLGKIPAISDPDGPDGRPVCVGESLAVATYLAEKAGKLMPSTLVERAYAAHWAAAAVAGLGPCFTHIFFSRMLDEDAHAKIITKLFEEIYRHLLALDGVLAARTWLTGESYSYADVLMFPTVAVTAPRFGVEVSRYPALTRWRDAIAARPAVVRGLAVLA